MSQVQHDAVRQVVDARATALEEAADLLCSAGARLEANGCPSRASAAYLAAAEIRTAEIPAVQGATDNGELRPPVLWLQPERLGTAARLLAELWGRGIKVAVDSGLGPDPGGRVTVIGAVKKLTPELVERLCEYERKVDALSALAGSGVFAGPQRKRTIADQLDDDIPF